MLAGQRLPPQYPLNQPIFPNAIDRPVTCAARLPLLV
jgi:hypothetical protein